MDQFVIDKLFSIYLRYYSKLSSDKGHLSSKLYSKTVAVWTSHQPTLYYLFIFYLPRFIHLTGFSFCIFSGFLAILILLSSNNYTFWILFSWEHTRKVPTLMKTFFLMRKYIIYPNYLTITRRLWYNLPNCSFIL